MLTVSIEKLAQEVGMALKKNNLQLAVAESCTGGGLGYWITSVPGSSDWFERGFITYSDLSKIEMLGVDSGIIEKFGAVSQETACAMVAGVLQHSRATIGVAITGIAGPDGGSPTKPVGTVWIAVAKKSMAPQANVEVFTGNRQEVRAQAIARALELVLKYVSDQFP